MLTMCVCVWLYTYVYSRALYSMYVYGYLNFPVYPYRRWSSSSCWCCCCWTPHQHPNIRHDGHFYRYFFLKIFMRFPLSFDPVSSHIWNGFDIFLFLNKTVLKTITTRPPRNVQVSAEEKARMAKYHLINNILSLLQESLPPSNHKNEHPPTHVQQHHIIESIFYIEFSFFKISTVEWHKKHFVQQSTAWLGREKWEDPIMQMV